MKPSRGSTTRRVVTASAVLTLALGALAGAETAVSPPAEALTPPVAMTADNLPTWQTNGIVWALAESDGVIFAGGSFTTIRPPGAAPGTQERPVRNFVALDAATGVPIEGCAPEFTVGSGIETVRALAVSPDGETLYVGGRFGAVDGIGASSVAAIDLSTCTPKPFSAGASNTVHALAATDDRVYLGGDFVQLNGQQRRYFGAVDTTGALVPGWVADGDEPGRALALTHDGENVVLGGDFFTINGVNSHALAIVDAGNAAMTRAYPLGFIETRSVVKDLHADATGIYTANEGTGGGVFDGRIAIEPDTHDQRWRDTCLGATQAVQVYRDVLYSGHHAHDCSSMGSFPNQPRFHLFAQSVHDPTLLGWFPDTNDGLGERIGPRAITVSEEHPTTGLDYMWVAGEFTAVNGSPQWGLTRFASEPDTGNPLTPEAHAFSHVPGEIEVTWRSSLDLDDSLLTYRVYRNNSALPVHTVQGSSVPWRRPQLSFTDTSVTEGVTYSYRITATDAAGNTSTLSPAVSATAASSTQPYVQAVLADRPVLYWRSDETTGNFASDASGNDNSGVHRGGPQRGVLPPAVNGPSAAAIGHNGSSTYTYSDTPFRSTNLFSVETWFRTTTTQGGRLIGYGNRILENSSMRDRHVYMRNDGRLVFGVNSGSLRTVTTNASYNDGQWHHVVATLGSNGMRLYVDGQQQAVNTSYTSAQNYGSTPGFWRVGGDSLASWPNRPTTDYFQGQLDEIAVYYSTLSAARVNAHFQAASVPSDTVVEAVPSADTYVNQAAPNNVHGTHQQLAVRSSPAYESYLRFDVPAAPPGTVLKAATLRIRLTNDAHAGSEDDQIVVPVVGDWSEAGTSWNTRPELGTDILGTLTGANAPGAVHGIPLDTAAVTAALGAELDLAVVGEGPSSLWFWSRQASSANQPRLLLTFGAP
ncbi:LamG-like jellyroll fold domain-containing protein [Streptomyces alkaliphilus]|uniref:LamG-like jellyroll fold domain-containing protein n=1 Tax=Streptomyces alkaliphilus TaxID=1472722 RepID=UPI00117DCBC9|nr:LamG-like jellyroll fold domain-containing protein [Streptomyces alkaliphilus]MQS07295.1 DNRLRE domain-containing protein [Streptomyces alkaliphilus]